MPFFNNHTWRQPPRHETTVPLEEMHKHIQERPEHVIIDMEETKTEGVYAMVQIRVKIPYN